MAATPENVKDITGSTVEDVAIQPFLNAASCVMNRISSCTESMSSKCKDQLEAYIASHLLVTSAVGQDDMLVTKESLNGKYSVEYLSPSATGQGIMGTTYGQTANAMSGGCLAQLDKKPVGLFSIGTI